LKAITAFNPLKISANSYKKTPPLQVAFLLGVLERVHGLE
jgi:hypothetical protein